MLNISTTESLNNSILVLSVSISMGVVVEPSHVDMLILGKFWFYFPNLGLVDKDAVIRLRIIGLQVLLVKTPEIT